MAMLMAKLGCSFPGCDNPVRVQKWMLCATHYNQRQAGKEQTPIKKPLLDCKFSGCSEPHRAKGWCTGHYSQVIVHKQNPRPLNLRIKTKRLCTYPDCGRKHCANGYCSTHDWHRRHGHVLKPIRSYPRRKSAA